MPNSLPELPPILLVVEDSDEDFATLKRIIEQESIFCQIDRCTTGDEALEYLFQSQHREIRPSLILLDLSLPGTDGTEILSRLKQTDALKAIPVVALAGDLHQREINWLYQIGISGYIVKQVDGIKFKRNMQRMIEYWFIANRLPS